jgi:hypothetical protein
MENMLIILLSHISALTISLIAIAWYRPIWLKALGNGLIRLSDAMQTARGVFQGSKPAAAVKRQKGPVAATQLSLTPTQQDVLDALLSHGARKSDAKKLLNRAIAELPATADFIELFRKASLAV